MIGVGLLESLRITATRKADEYYFIELEIFDNITAGEVMRAFELDPDEVGFDENGAWIASSDAEDAKEIFNTIFAVDEDQDEDTKRALLQTFEE